MPRPYRYRLTITYADNHQVRMGLDDAATADTVARFVKAAHELSAALKVEAKQLAHVCLSYERTGQVIWLKQPKDIGHEEA